MKENLALKKTETITCGNVSKYLLAFGEEPKRKLLKLILQESFTEIIMYMALVLKFLIYMSKCKIFWHQKVLIQMLWIFNCDRHILVRLSVKMFESEILLHAI